MCSFRYNNFIKNVNHASFVSEGFLNAKSNNWLRNYWQNIIGTEMKLFKRMPRKITGTCHFKNIFGRFKIITFKFVRVYDLRPERISYEIE